MATLICNGNGNLTGAATFAAAEIGANALALVRNSTTTFAAAASSTSSTFTVTNGKVIDAVLLWLFAAAGATGTIKVDLQKGGVSQASVTVNKADLPDNNNSIPCPVVFKLGSTATGDGGSNWTIVVTTTGTGTVTYYRATSTTANFTRALRTTTSATAAAGDDLYITGELTGAGTHTSYTVTMDSTTATAYGNGSVNSTTVSGGLVAVSCYGTLTYGNSASTNYILRLAADLGVYQYGTLNIGSSGAEIPRSSTAVLEFQPASADGDFGLQIRNGTWNGAGLSRTAGKNIIKCLLTADVSITSNAIQNGSSNGTQSQTSAGPDVGGGTSPVGSWLENSTNGVHTIMWTYFTATATALTGSVWLAQGTGVNNRYVRLTIGNSSTLGSVTDGFYVDIDLQAGTLGTATAIGAATSVSATIVAVGGGYFVKLMGTPGVSSSKTLHLTSCSAPGTTSYAGSNALCFYFDHVNLELVASISDTTWNVDADTGWLSGDVVCVASTSRTAAECEPMLLKANAGASSFTTSLRPFGYPRTNVSATTFTHAGTAPIQAEVILLTRNVKIRSTSPTLMAYVYCTAAAVVTISWMEFYGLGAPFTSTKRGLEIDTGTATGAKNITYCSFHDNDGYGIYCGGGVSLNLTFSYNVIWHTTSAGVNLANTISNADWALDNNVVMLSGSNGFSLGDVGGSLTNNTAIGSASAGFDISPSSNGVYTVGTSQNNTAHSGVSNGISVNIYVVIGVLDGFKTWRNGSYGLYIVGNDLSDLRFTNTLNFGNNFAAAYTSVATVLNISDSVLCGDSTYPTTTGIHTQSLGSQQFNLDNVDMTGDSSAYSSLLVPCSGQDFYFVTLSSKVQAICRNCLFGAPLLINDTNGPKMTWRKEAFMSFQKFNQTASDHRTEMAYGQLKTDTSIYNTASPSMRMTPNNASNKLPSAPKGKGILVAVANGSSVDISVFINKDAAYNGNQPRLIQRANPALGQDSDVVLATYSAGTGSWNQLTATSSTATDDGAWEFVVDCDGTAGFINIDDWATA